MTLPMKPLNRDYSETEGLGKDGKPKDKSSKGMSNFAKTPRLNRKRGRFKIPTTIFKLETRTHDWDGDQPVNPHTEVSEYRYYETVEVTEDTISNKSFNPPKVEKGKIVDSGGEFTHYKIEFTDIVAKNIHNIFDSETFHREVVGTLVLGPLPFEHEGLENIVESIKPPESDLDLSEIGPRLWKVLNPLNPSVDLGINIAEIRDLPRLVKGKFDSIKSLVKSLSNPKGVAEWFLGIQFGWKPLLSDIRKVIKLHGRLESRIQFLMRNGGKPLYRHTPKWEPVVTTEVLFQYSGPDNQGWMFDIVPVGSDPDSMVDRFKCKLELRKTVTEKASGVFLYHIGIIPPTPAYLRLKLVGLIADEGLIWEATRWSWLIDWFSNMGDVISNIKANLRDRVVSVYAYSQREIKREYKWTCTNGFYEVSVTRVFNTKRRAKIDPFGLTVGAALSRVQLGILVALGITR